MNEAIKYLKDKKKYDRLISKWEETKSLDHGFEILHCYQCESAGMDLAHEASVNPESKKSVDFSTKIDGVTVNMELVRIGLNKGIRELKRKDELQGYLLKSNESDPDFRTGAQIIKLQWGILEKVGKLPEASNETINIICVDCSNVHAGMLDAHDVAITIWGKPYDPIWIENWEGERIKGMLEKEYTQRGSVEFKERVSAVIFVQKLKCQPLTGAYIAVNNQLSTDHIEIVIETLKKNNAFTGLRLCRST